LAADLQGFVLLRQPFAPYESSAFAGKKTKKRDFSFI
jgi:hypothetical protein